jgi:hypothetical protein
MRNLPITTWDDDNPIFITRCYRRVNEVATPKSVGGCRSRSRLVTPHLLLVQPYTLFVPLLPLLVPLLLLILLVLVLLLRVLSSIRGLHKPHNL